MIGAISHLQQHLLQCGPKTFFHEKLIKDEIVQVCRSLRMWHQMTWFVRVFVLDFQLWLWFWQLTAKAQPKEEGRADRTMPELQEEAICWMYLTKITKVCFPQSLREMKCCSRWSLTRNSLFWRFQVHQRGGQFPLSFFYSTPNWRTSMTPSCSRPPNRKVNMLECRWVCWLELESMNVSSYSFAFVHTSTSYHVPMVRQCQRSEMKQYEQKSVFELIFELHPKSGTLNP